MQPPGKILVGLESQTAVFPWQFLLSRGPRKPDALSLFHRTSQNVRRFLRRQHKIVTSAGRQERKRELTPGHEIASRSQTEAVCPLPSDCGQAQSRQDCSSFGIDLRLLLGRFVGEWEAESAQGWHGENRDLPRGLYRDTAVVKAVRFRVYQRRRDVAQADLRQLRSSLAFLYERPRFVVVHCDRKALPGDCDQRVDPARRATIISGNSNTDDFGDQRSLKFLTQTAPGPVRIPHAKEKRRGAQSEEAGRARRTRLVYAPSHQTSFGGVPGMTEGFPRGRTVVVFFDLAGKENCVGNPVWGLERAENSDLGSTTIREINLHKGKGLRALRSTAMPIEKGVLKPVGLGLNRVQQNAGDSLASDYPLFRGVYSPLVGGREHLVSIASRWVELCHRTKGHSPTCHRITQDVIPQGFHSRLSSPSSRHPFLQLSFTPAVFG